MRNKALALTIASSTLALLTGRAAAQPTPAAGAPAEPPPTTAPPEVAPEPEPPPPAPPPPEDTDGDTDEDAAAPSLAPKLTGFIDGTYNYNFNHPAGGVTPFHSYTAKHHTFLLNSAHVELNGSDAKLGYSVQIDGGTDAVVDSGGSYFDVQEAYATYVADSGVGVKVGKFVTYNGIEVIESGANPTISRGFLFGLAEPYTHVGGVVTYKINDQLDVAAGAINGWDLIVDNNSTKTMVAKLGYTTEKLLMTVSAYAGPEQPINNDNWRTTLDATGEYKLDKIDLWFQGNVGMEQGAGPLDTNGNATGATWFGVGVQPVFHVEDDLSVGGRVELFDDADGARSGTKQMLVNLSVAPAYSPTKQLTFRAEARLDLSTGRDAGVAGPFVTTKADANDLQVIGLTEAILSF